MSAEKTLKVVIADIEWADNIRSARSPERIGELAASIQRLGQLVPIRVRRVGEALHGIDGKSRCQAAQSLGWTEITAIVDETKLSKADVIVQQLVTNCQRDDLSVADKGRSIELLMSLCGQTLSEVADGMGFSVATVSRWLAGHRLPDCLRDRVVSGALGLTTALEIAKTYRREEYEDAAREAVDGNLSRDALIGRRKRRPEPSTAPPRPAARFTGLLPTGSTVSVTGAAGDLDGVIAVLEELLGRARRARTKGHSAATFSKMLRDEAKAAPAQAAAFEDGGGA